MVTQTVTLDELKMRTIEDILSSVADLHHIVYVKLPSGAEVTIQPKQRLEPLPVLEGRIPSHWKEAIYSES